MARTFEYVLHFVRCVTVTVSPNQIIIIIIIILIEEVSDVVNEDVKKKRTDTTALWHYASYRNYASRLL